MLLTHRKLLQSKAIAIDNDLRGTLRNFSLKVGMAGKARFEARIRERVENLPDLARWSNRCSLFDGPFASSSASCIAACWPSSGMTSMPALDDDPGCWPSRGADLSRHRRRTSSIPKLLVRRGGVWADPFQVSIREINRAGAISGCGDEMTRVMLYEAAHIILVRLAKWSWLKAD